MTAPERGTIVAWSHAGAAQYGIVEGREGDKAFVRRLDGNRADRTRLLPKMGGQLLELYTAASFVGALRDRAKAVLADRNQPTD